MSLALREVLEGIDARTIPLEIVEAPTYCGLPKYRAAGWTLCVFDDCDEWDNPHSIDPQHYIDARKDSLLCADSLRYVPRYDTNWSATGPLIERFRLDIGTEQEVWSASVCEVGRDFYVAYGSTPLIAVCELILALKAAGKLPAILPPVPNGVLPDLADPGLKGP